MLVPTNDPYYLAAKIIEVASDKKLQMSMSEMNRKIAEKRHSDENIYKDLMFCYTSIINKMIIEILKKLVGNLIYLWSYVYSFKVKICLVEYALDCILCGFAEILKK